MISKARELANCQGGKLPVNVSSKVLPITGDSRVQDVVEHHPQTILVFSRHGLQCVGCYISPFHTIADSAREYAMALEPLLHDLNQAISAQTIQGT
jgi:hybrid cluster-associated redox disulfide protein